MHKGKKLVEDLRELIEQVPPQFQKKNGNGNGGNGKENGKENGKNGNGGGKTEATIKELADTDYKDKDAFFKMVQLLKGLAANADKDEMARKFLEKVSDELTDAAEDVMEESVLGEAMMPTQDQIDAGDEYLRGQSRTVSKLVSDMATFIKKKTGKAVGMKAAAEIIRAFLAR